jgi:hypothetical protein
VEGLILLLLFAVGGGGRGTTGGGTGNGGGTGGGTGNGGWKGGPAGPGSVPSGDPPGGCRLVYQSPASTLQALNLLGYTPLPEIWGPDAQLGTMDADPDPEVQQFQLDYNQASRSKWIGSNGGGLSPDGLMGRCTMAAMSNAQVSQGAAAWRERYMPKVTLGGIATG